MTLEKISEIAVVIGRVGVFFVAATSDQLLQLVPFGFLCARSLKRGLHVVEWGIFLGSAASVWNGLVYKELAYAKRDFTYTFCFKKLIPRRLDTVTLPIRIVVHRQLWTPKLVI